MQKKLSNPSWSERPREQLFGGGAARLANTDLLAVVLGAGIAGCPAESVATALVEDAGDLFQLSRASAAELVGVAGIGEARAARVVAAFELGRRALLPPRRDRIRGPEDVHRLLLPEISGLAVELGWVIGLSARNDVIARLEIARGEAAAVPVHPREVFRPLIRHGAVGGVFVHNHPSGDPTPSEEDVALTHRLVAVGELVGIPLIDHLVVTPTGFASLASHLGTEYRQ